uniref:DNA polymerase theta-like helix-turn-helix domain-containing protein n=1 Tax=Labrus bergylta TaxID=56723 RepID=A0A3Q3F5K4_9LABR
ACSESWPQPPPSPQGSTSPLEGKNIMTNTYLQIIVGGVASTPQDVTLYASCSLLAASMKSDSEKDSNEETSKGAIEACVEWLMENEFISIQREEQGTANCALLHLQ